MFFRITLAMGALSSFPLPAIAGSVGNSAYQSSAVFDCDKRERFIQCTAEMKQHVLDKCYVVVHSKNRPDCSWQSCGAMSVVQQRAKIVDSNVIEYGVKTAIPAEIAANPPADWGCDAQRAECLPKSPSYERSYYTVREALALRSNSSASSDALKLSQIPEDVLDANPYLECAKRSDEPAAERFHVHMKLSSSGTPLGTNNTVALTVHRNKVKEACEALKAYDKNGTCFVTHIDDRLPTASNSVAIANFNESSFACPAKPETRERWNYSTAKRSLNQTCAKETQTRSMPQKRSNGACVSNGSWSPWSGTFTNTSCVQK
ncbi:MAG: hypothetical protein EBR09_02410 [Proteobacteria bacterium]|nr:hypothetical protein [Pseudomonadota bacterium]